MDAQEIVEAARQSNADKARMIDSMARRTMIAYAKVCTLRPEADWHEDDGNVLWWRVPIEEPPYVGSPLDTDWPEGIYTHWSPLPPCGDLIHGDGEPVCD